MNDDWLIIIRAASGGITAHSVRADRVLERLEELPLNEIEGISVVDPATRRVGDEALRDVVSASGSAARTFILILAWSPPPTCNVRYERDEIRSFYCSSDLLIPILDILRMGRVAIGEACFACVRAIASNQLEAGALYVRQAARVRQPVRTPEPSSCALVMAHRGLPMHLETALSSILACRGADRLRIRVGLDADDIEPYRRLSEKFPVVEFYSAKPTPAGPYVVRTLLIDQSAEPVTMFHDSDDLSCSDRFQELLGSLDDDDDGVGLVGSHELRIDEITESLIAVRFPLNVSRALALGADHAQLHPSTVIRRAIYQASGGFSTDRDFSNDTQFIQRVYFFTQIRNVDEFLYIRRKHQGAITARPDVGLGTVIRLRTEAAWRNDFHRVSAGTLNLDQSSLRAQHTTGGHSLSECFPAPALPMPLRRDRHGSTTAS